MSLYTSDELKRRLVAHAVNLDNFTTDLKKSEKRLDEATRKGDDLLISLEEEIASSHRRSIEHIKGLILKDAKALSDIEGNRKQAIFRQSHQFPRTPPA